MKSRQSSSSNGFDFGDWIRRTDANRAITTAPLVSFVISTYNRRDVLLDTLARVERCGLALDQFEIIVVDNASSDGTADALRERYQNVKLLAQKTNVGPCAKNAGIKIARAPYIVFLDDDSYPRPGSITAMIRHFQSDPRLGAAGFNVHLTDGSQECSAYPDVFIGCGVGLRSRAIWDVGVLPTDFFMAAEEYDLALRLLDGGWKVETFNDLHVTHLKTPGARSSQRITRLDVRNNLTLIARYFPPKWQRQYRRDWIKRYWMHACAKGHRKAFLRGAIEGLIRASAENPRPVKDQVFEQFAKIEQTRRVLQQAKEQHSLKRVLLIDLGKNMFAYWQALRDCGIQAVAIADRGVGDQNRSYRGIPIVDDERARRMVFDAAIVSNLSPVHAAQRRIEWRALDARPIIDLFEEIPALTAGREKPESLQTVARSA